MVGLIVNDELKKNVDEKSSDLRESGILVFDYKD